MSVWKVIDGRTKNEEEGEDERIGVEWGGFILFRGVLEDI